MDHSRKPLPPRFPSPWQARALLTSVLVLATAGVAITFSPLRSGSADQPPSARPGDVALYNAEIARMRAGEGYYAAAAAELTTRGYPTASVFNWRTPLPMWFIARMPEQAGKVSIGLLAIVLIGWCVRLMAREAGLGAASLCGILMFGAVMPVFLDDLYAMPVLWAGVLLGLSVCCYGEGRRGWGVVAGIAALFCRDLAGPYCLASALWALWRRRWSEVLAWGVALTAYAVFFGGHLLLARQFTMPDASAHEQGWVRFGGLPFLIALTQVNAYLLISPQWASALFLAAAIAGNFAWNSSLARRAGGMLCLYWALFAVVGQPFNQYWGALLAPVLCLGAARFPWVVRPLLSACRGSDATQTGKPRQTREIHGIPQHQAAESAQTFA